MTCEYYMQHTLCTVIPYDGSHFNFPIIILSLLIIILSLINCEFHKIEIILISIFNLHLSVWVLGWKNSKRFCIFHQLTHDWWNMTIRDNIQQICVTDEDAMESDFEKKLQNFSCPNPNTQTCRKAFELKIFITILPISD